MAAGGRETPGIDRSQQDGHRLQSIHGVPSTNERVLPGITIYLAVLGGLNRLPAVSLSSGPSNINLRRVRMSGSSQIALIRKLYGARGNVNAFKSLLADDLEYDIAEGFPNGGVYRGIDRVVNDFFE